LLKLNNWKCKNKNKQ